MKDSSARHSGRHPGRLLAAIGLGAALMYLLDPQQGRARVARGRDRGARLVRVGRDRARAGVRDLSNRTAGLAARLLGTLRRDSPDDDVLLERVRAHLGRCVSHPHALQVEAVDGWVTLAGPVLAHEAACLLREVSHVRGVRHIKDRLERHEAGSALPLALQGGRARTPAASTHLPPGPKLALMGAGALLTLAGTRRRGLKGTLMGLAGAALSARAAADWPVAGTPRRVGAPDRSAHRPAPDAVETGRETPVLAAGGPGAPAWSEQAANGRPLASESR